VQFRQGGADIPLLVGLCVVAVAPGGHRTGDHHNIVGCRNDAITRPELLDQGGLARADRTADPQREHAPPRTGIGAGARCPRRLLAVAAVVARDQPLGTVQDQRHVQRRVTEQHARRERPRAARCVHGADRVSGGRGRRERDGDAVGAVGEGLRVEQVGAVAIGFMHAYAWPEHVNRDGNPVAVWSEPYGFVPLVLTQHINVGMDWGWSEFHASLSKFREVDDLASKLDDQIRKTVDAKWAVIGMPKPKDTPSVKGRAITTDNEEPGRDEEPEAEQPSHA